MSEALTFKLPEHLAARRTAQRREWTTQFVAVSIAVVCFVGAGLMITPINSVRREKQLVIDPETLGTLPPDLALLGKLGTFRALAIDWASIRAERLKEEGKYYEALQLHETICALAPRFAQVWIYAAWNMAYNISVAQYSPEARWQWVRNGITILRDKGIQYNPRAVALYKELAWIYWHKIGDFLDDHHRTYKRALAVEIERVLGAPPVALSDEAYFAWFRKIVDAPRDLPAFLKSRADVERLVFQLRQVRLAPDETLLEFVARHIRPELRPDRLRLGKNESDELTTNRLQILRDPENEASVEDLLAAVRSDVLRTRHRLDLDLMWSLMGQFGPLDWRNAFSHALYWSSLGERVSQGHENLSIHDQINNARFILMAMQNMILRGRITLWANFDEPFESYLELTPDPRYIPYLYDAYMHIGEKYFKDDPRFKPGTPGPSFMVGFVSSVTTWIQLLYLEGGEKNTKLAEQFYAWLRENNPHPNGATQERYLQTLDHFVMGDILSQLHTYKAAEAYVRTLIGNALKRYSLDMGESAFNSLLLARKAYEYWMTDTRNDINQRRQLQTFQLIVRDEIEAFLTNHAIAALYKASLWRNLSTQSVDLCQMVYDRVAPYFQKLCEVQTPPWDVKVAFPEPPGMAEFRLKEAIEFRGAPRRKDAEEGERG
jgi:hypothetical protein